MDRAYFNGRRKKRREELLNLLGGECENCGSKDNLHFDHKNPKRKKFRIADNIDAPKDILFAEVEKCRLLCNKCHHEKTLKNQEYGKESGHGTLWRYKKYKCRCDKCKEKMSEYNREKRQKLLKEITKDI
jgi:5-methylcytosine-specific restriction endonuclease McrA